MQEIRKAAELVAMGESVPRAMVAVGYAKTTADKQSHMLKNRPDFQQAVAEIKAALLRRNVTADRIAQKIDEGLEANETKFFAHEGEVIESRDCADYATREKYVRLAARLLGYDTERDDPGGGMTINVNAFFTLIRQAEKARGL